MNYWSYSCCASRSQIRRQIRKRCCNSWTFEQLREGLLKFEINKIFRNLATALTYF